jgi:hypothetical protein
MGSGFLILKSDEDWNFELLPLEVFHLKESTNSE